MNWPEYFLTVQTEQTPMKQTPILTAEENCLLDETKTIFFRAQMSLNCDQQSPVSYRLKSPTPSLHRPPSGPHPVSSWSPFPSISRSFPNSGLFYSGPAALPGTWKSFCLPDLYPSVSTNRFDWHVPANFQSCRRKVKEMERSGLSLSS